MSFTAGMIKFVVDEAGNTRCGFEMVLPSGAVQQGVTDLYGALHLLALAFPQSASTLRSFATQQTASTSTTSSGTTPAVAPAATTGSTGSSTATVSVALPILNLGVKL